MQECPIYRQFLPCHSGIYLVGESVSPKANAVQLVAGGDYSFPRKKGDSTIERLPVFAWHPQATIPDNRFERVVEQRHGFARTRALYPAELRGLGVILTMLNAEFRMLIESTSDD